jgi:hypothetical protein
MFSFGFVGSIPHEHKVTHLKELAEFSQKRGSDDCPLARTRLKEYRPPIKYCIS